MSKRLSVPLPFRDRIEAYGDLTYAQIHEAVTGSRVREVPLSILTSTQKTVGGPRLAMYEAGQVRKRSGEEPVVIAHGGQLFIHNGHHRSTMAARRGDRTLRARVASTGPQPPRHFGHEGQLLMMSERATSVEYREHDVEDVATMVGDVAVICIDTPLESKPGAGWWNYFDDYESIFCRFANAIQSEDVRSVLLKIDSPGGAAQGLNECVDAMRRLKKRVGKPVAAYADEGAYSAAYALACVADKVYLPKAGGLGSIGVISQIVSFDEANKKAGVKVVVVKSGARKDDAHPDVPVSDKAVAHLQRRVDQLAKIYFKLVAKVRGIDARPLEADTFYGKDAVKKGLADEVMTLDEVLESMGLDKSRISKSTSTSKRDSGDGDEMSISKAKAALDAAIAGGDKAKIAEASAALDSAIKAGKKIVTTETKSTESSASSVASSEGSEEEESESMPTAEESEHSGSSMSSMASSDSASSEEEEEEEEKYEEEEERAAKQFAKRAATALALPKTARAALAREARAFFGPVMKSAHRATGKASISSIRGALDAMPSQRAHTKKLAKEVAALKTDKVRAKVDRYIAKAIKAGKVVPAERESLRAAGIKDPKWLKANLAARPVVVTRPGSEFVPREGTGGQPANEEQAAMLKAATAGMSEEDRKKFEAGQSARLGKTTNGHPAH